MPQNLWLAGTSSDLEFSKTKHGFAKKEYKVMKVAISSLSLLGTPTWVAAAGPPVAPSTELGSPIDRVGNMLKGLAK